MMKDTDSIVRSWVKESDTEIEDEFHSTGLNEIQLDDLPSDPLDLGPNQRKRAREMDAVRCMMTDLGWTEPLHHT